ncbi:MAG: hypothetical protein HY661_11515 [Betaproteobacteria bacterium]|nr:hypothetical protein [Betaproteobacteria bacterium]
MTRLLSIFLLSAIYSFAAQAADPAVAKFEGLIKRASLQSAALGEPYQDKAGKWRKTTIRITDVLYDVKKTDSLVSPLAGQVAFTLTTETSEWADTRELAKTAKPDAKSLPHRYQVRLSYGWRDGVWKFSRGDSEFRLVHPLFADDPPLRQEISLAAYEKEPNATLFAALRGWLYP